MSILQEGRRPHVTMKMVLLDIATLESLSLIMLCPTRFVKRKEKGEQRAERAISEQDNS